MTEKKTKAKKSKLPKIKDLSPRKNPRGGGISYNTNPTNTVDGPPGSGSDRL